ncbi:MAG: DNA starvation/stationary phase protection protein [Acidobacteria bacterium]|nr:DNA starvation/stationary phase protection protein [Acidobacteriota bacterium]
MAKSAMVEEITQANREDSPIVAALETQLANAFVLYANYKHYHWQTFGPLFRDLHKLFDELAGGALETVDELAERLRMIGQDPPFRLSELERRASIRTSSGTKNMRERVAEADASEIQVIKELRDAIKVAEDQDDPGSVDMLSKFVRIHEKNEWFLREILKKGDGLVA